MNIAVIGSGNVGLSLALGLHKAGHRVVLGVRDVNGSFKGRERAQQEGLPWRQVVDAVAASEVVLLCAPGHLAHEVAAGLGDVEEKVIIDTMNAVARKPGDPVNSSESVLANCNAVHLAKCFNTTGFENMANPLYNGTGIDMFVAGTTGHAKEVAARLAADIGFGAVHDFGGREQISLLEQLAMCWINLAIFQKQGRDIAFRVVRRNG